LIATTFTIAKVSMATFFYPNKLFHHHNFGDHSFQAPPFQLPHFLVAKNSIAKFFVDAQLSITNSMMDNKGFKGFHLVFSLSQKFRDFFLSRKLGF